MGNTLRDTVPPDAAHRERWIAEEGPHREQAQVRPAATMRQLEPGTAIPDAPIYALDGNPLTLGSVWAEKPALVVTGSLTCPPSRVFVPALNYLRQRFGDRIDACLLYVIDAHPADSVCPYTGTHWLTEDNEREQVLVSQPVTLEERVALARRFIGTAGLEVAVYVDGMDNAAWDALGRSPNMAALVGTDGRCRLYQDWLMPAALTTALEAEIER